MITQTDRHERAKFVATLEPALGGPIQVLATMRPKFLDPLSKDADLSKLAARIHQVRPLESKALRSVIEEPAKVAGLSCNERVRQFASALDAVVKLLEREGQQWQCSAFVRRHPLLNAGLADQLQRHAATTVGLTVSIDLGADAKTIWSAMSKGRANAVNRARRAGYTVTISPAYERIEEFAAVYADTTRRLGAAQSNR